MKDSFGRWPTWRENVAIGLGAVFFPPWNLRATAIGFLGTWMIVAFARQVVRFWMRHWRRFR